MIRSIFRSLIFLVLLCTVGGYLFYLKTGVFPSFDQILTSPNDEAGPDLKRLSEMPVLNSVDHDETIQKWQDENGTWHFSNKQNSNGL
jgi:hypothetical protein